MENFESITIVKTRKGVTATYYKSTSQNQSRKVKKSVRFSDLEHPDDFLYACAYLIDEFANIKPFEGKTVCISSPFENYFKVGKIYEWKDGRTVDEQGELRPEIKIFSLEEEIIDSNLKFIKLVGVK